MLVGAPESAALLIFCHLLNPPLPHELGILDRASRPAFALDRHAEKFAVAAFFDPRIQEIDHALDVELAGVFRVFGIGPAFPVAAEDPAVGVVVLLLRHREPLLFGE